jgi:hypothetical protein
VDYASNIDIVIRHAIDPAVTGFMSGPADPITFFSRLGRIEFLFGQLLKTKKRGLVGESLMSIFI